MPTGRTTGECGAAAGCGAGSLAGTDGVTTDGRPNGAFGSMPMRRLRTSILMQKARLS